MIGGPGGKFSGIDNGWGGGGPQRLATPPAPQAWVAGQFCPQLTVPPQPSGIRPQLFELHTRGVQPQVWLFWQMLGSMQLPHEMVPPQPSAMLLPQLYPAEAQVVAVQPQTLAVPPPPQVWGAVQVPQLSVPPQVSERPLPPLYPRCPPVLAEQPHTLAVPPPPPVCG